MLLIILCVDLCIFIAYGMMISYDGIYACIVEKAKKKIVKKAPYVIYMANCTVIYFDE